MARGKGHKLRHRQFPLSIRKHFSIARVTEHWHRLRGEVVEFPFLEVLQSYLGQLDLGVPTGTVELDWRIFSGLFQPQPFCDRAWWKEIMLSAP